MGPLVGRCTFTVFNTGMSTAPNDELNELALLARRLKLTASSDAPDEATDANFSRKHSSHDLPPIEDIFCCGTIASAWTASSNTRECTTFCRSLCAIAAPLAAA